VPATPKLSYQTALRHVGAAIGGQSPGKVTRKQSLRGATMAASGSNGLVSRAEVGHYLSVPERTVRVPHRFQLPLERVGNSLSGVPVGLPEYRSVTEMI
jgi:hypothetical protein